MRLKFLDAISEKEKYDILYRYLVKEEKIKDIYETFRGRYSISWFGLAVSNYLLTDMALMCKVLKAKMPEKVYNETFLIAPGVLDSKLESYWIDEEEVLFNPATYNVLSIDEKLIFDESN